MSERDAILIDFVKNLLGPRAGSREVLPSTDDPLNRYITGVLAPEVDAFQPTIEQADDEIDAEDVSGEDSGGDEPAPVSVPGAFSPSLDPRARPRSIGISFVVSSPTEPRLAVCATWARYRADPTGWVRAQAYLIVDVDPTQPIQQFERSGVRIVSRCRLIRPSCWRVSIYLLNALRAADPDRAKTDEHLFQPEIRVLCGEQTHLEALDEPPDHEATADERSMWLLYRHRPGLARGHMCGATWREIDPQVPVPPRAFREPPFFWIDGDQLPPTERSRFESPDVRSELVPLYGVLTPSMAADQRFGGATFDPDVLAETCDSAGIRSALEPLAASYARWILDREAEITALPTEAQAAARANIAACRDAASRISAGIDLLGSDPECRLAFCFANKAIALQARWSQARRAGAAGPARRQMWRPFQLAFIVMNVCSLANPLHGDRLICDLLWIPTGGGKTEAYLGLAAFAIALRRLRAPRDRDGHRTGDGVCVMSRYTLRLLTIQQFRRALRLVTACESLRSTLVQGAFGWRPARATLRDDFLWGSARIGIGLWVGGGVTPNRLEEARARDDNGTLWWFPGAVNILQNDPPPRGHRAWSGSAEPAQVLECPACAALLGVPNDGLAAGTHELHFVFKSAQGISAPVPASVSTASFVVATQPRLTTHSNPTFYTLSIEFSTQRASLADIEDWWRDTLAPAVSRGQRGAELQASRAARPGYFVRGHRNQQQRIVPFDFEIVCPNPGCELNSSREWCEKVPVPTDATTAPSADRSFQQVLEPFQIAGTGQRRADRVPIPAFTVDDQVYRRCPTIVVATVDKFARLAFEPGAASLFGNVEFYHPRSGFYRIGCPPGEPGANPSHPKKPALSKSVAVMAPPDLIIQDELHLVEGPLGSMVGVYETAIDKLCERSVPHGVQRPKYVASTATVRRAEEQVRALFDRAVAYFPPPGLSADDNFFARGSEAHPLDNRNSGRLYVGVCAPGWGALTPIIRVWSALLQSAWERRQAGVPAAEIDPFWTLVGYFNAIRELAGAVALYRQDIRQWLPEIAVTTERPLPDEDPHELSSRRGDPLALPSLLDMLDVELPADASDAVVATSMFGTGVDVSRLGLMVVHGQPKTTAAYIQATGRVGRREGGLVVTLLRAPRVRDLAHYEYFTGYHRQLYRHVEPITVTPFAARARERALGPISVAMLRQARSIGNGLVHADWRVQQRTANGYICEAKRMANQRQSAEVVALPAIFEDRANTQPINRRPFPGATATEASAELDRWSSLANQLGSLELRYSEATLLRGARTSVVLGDPAHQRQVPVVVFENAPNSLREVEATTTFKTR